MLCSCQLRFGILVKVKKKGSFCSIFHFKLRFCPFDSIVVLMRVDGIHTIFLPLLGKMSGKLALLVIELCVTWLMIVFLIMILFVWMGPCCFRSILWCLMFIVTILCELLGSYKFYSPVCCLSYLTCFVFCTENAPALWPASRKRRRLKIAIWISYWIITIRLLGITGCSIWPFVLLYCSDFVEGCLYHLYDTCYILFRPFW